MPAAGRVVYNGVGENVEKVRHLLEQVIVATAGAIVEVATASMEGQDPPSIPGHAPAIRSGLLHGSLKVDDSHIALLEATAYTDVEYAQHLEFGTIRMAARPFLRPAAEQVRPSFEAAIRTAMRRLR